MEGQIYIDPGETRKEWKYVFTLSFPLYKDDFEIIVVIDVLRATSAICAAFHYGVKDIIPVSTIEEAQEYQRKGFW